MCSSPSTRRWAALAWFVGLATSLFAQVPSTIVALKMTEYRQTSATDQSVVSYGLGVYVNFAAPPASGTSVTLSRPGSVTLTLYRQADGSFQSVSTFASAPQLASAYPDGTYTLSVGGGGANSSTVITIATGAPIPPVLITDYDALQATPYATGASVAWQQIAGSDAPGAFLAMSLTKADGTEIPTPSPSPAYVTYVQLGGPLPYGEPVTGSLSYAVLTSVASLNNGATNFASGAGFDVEFPVEYSVAKPEIGIQPVDTPVAGGDTLNLQGGAWESKLPVGINVTYQWYKDAMPIPGATNKVFTLPVAHPSDAGRYMFSATDVGGTTFSNSATVVVGAGLTVTAFAGSGSAGAADGAGLAAQFNVPVALTVDAVGNLYVLDGSGTTVRKVTPAGVVTTLAGAAGQAGSTDGVGSAARFSAARGVAAAADGTVYVADTGNGTVRKIAADGTVTTLAGSPIVKSYVDGPGATARFYQPSGIAMDATGTLYVADGFAIRRITADGMVSTYAGGRTTTVEQDGPLSVATFFNATGLGFGPDGTLYVAEPSPGRLRAISPAGQVTSPGWPAWADHAAFDRNGNLYVPLGDQVQIVSPNGISQMVAGYSPGDNDGFGKQAGLGWVNAVVTDGAGNVYLLDNGRNRIRKGVLTVGTPNGGVAVATPPQSTTVAAGSTAVLYAKANALGTYGQWRKNGALLNAYWPYLIIPNAQPADAAVYTYDAFNVAGGTVTTPATLTVLDNTPASRLSNLSIRTTAGSGSQVLIVGVAIAGSGTGTKNLLVRGIGPGLARYGVTGLLPDPVLTVYQGQQVVATNDDWAAGLAPTFDALQAFSLTPGSADAALLAPLAPGVYTAQVTGKGATGTALAELYDADAATSGLRLTNVSARAEVGTGDNVLFAGFAVTGTAGKTVLIRGVGPSLSQFGITASEYLANPRIDVYSGQTAIASNAGGVPTSALGQVPASVGAFSLLPATDTSADAVLLTTLQPGAYTVKVSGVGDTTGVALVEVYEVP